MKKIEKMKKKKPRTVERKPSKFFSNNLKKRLPRNENPQPGSTKNRPKTRVKVKPKELYGKRYTPNLTENKKAPVIKNPKFKVPKDGKPTVMIPATRSQESPKSTEVRKRLKPLKGSPYYQRWKKK